MKTSALGALLTAGAAGFCLAQCTGNELGWCGYLLAGGFALAWFAPAMFGFVMADLELRGRQDRIAWPALLLLAVALPAEILMVAELGCVGKILPVGVSALVGMLGSRCIVRCRSGRVIADGGR